MATERAFLGALERTRQARRDGDALVLLDEAGAETARFIAAEL
ncbi:MAG: META domain-containing protein [Terricaulis sp.]